MNLFKNKIALLFVLGFTSLINAALPSNISELVETSAPAVVNITSRKEVKMQNSRLVENAKHIRNFGTSRDG